MNTPLCSAVYRRGQKAAQSCSCPIMPTFLATLINKMHPTESKMFVTPKNHTKTGKAVGRGGGQGATQGFFHYSCQNLDWGGMEWGNAILAPTALQK